VGVRWESRERWFARPDLQETEGEVAWILEISSVTGCSSLLYKCWGMQ
jgi:hypothetical protein